MIDKYYSIDQRDDIPDVVKYKVKDNLWVRGYDKQRSVELRSFIEVYLRGECVRFVHILNSIMLLFLLPYHQPLGQPEVSEVFLA